MRLDLRRPALPILLAALAGCWPFHGFAYDEHLVGPYRLNAIDTMDQMAIVWEIPGGGLVGDGLPGPTVFAAGFDSRVLVAAVHPPVCPEPGEECVHPGIRRDVTEFWVVIRQPDEAEHLPYSGIRGSFTADRFEALKRRHGLPDFSVRFPELE